MCVYFWGQFNKIGNWIGIAHSEKSVRLKQELSNSLAAKKKKKKKDHYIFVIKSSIPQTTQERKQSNRLMSAQFVTYLPTF